MALAQDHVLSPCSVERYGRVGWVEYRHWYSPPDADPILLKVNLECILCGYLGPPFEAMFRDSETHLYFFRCPGCHERLDQREDGE